MSYVRFKLTLGVFLCLAGKISNKKRKGVIAEVWDQAETQKEAKGQITYR